MSIRFYLNPNDITSAVKTLLNADCTLQTSAYLNGTNNIWTNRIPREQPGKNLMIELSSPISASMMQTYDIEIRVHCYTPLLMNDQIDPISNTILERCEQLLNNTILSISNARCLPLVSFGAVPSFFDEQGGPGVDKSHGVVRFEARVDPN